MHSFWLAGITLYNLLWPVIVLVPVPAFIRPINGELSSSSKKLVTAGLCYLFLLCRNFDSISFYKCRIIRGANFFDDIRQVRVLHLFELQCVQKILLAALSTWK